MTQPESQTSSPQDAEQFRAPAQIPEHIAPHENESDPEQELRRENESLRELTGEQARYIQELMFDSVTDLKNRRIFLQDGNDAIARGMGVTFERIHPKVKEGIEVYRYGGDEFGVLITGKNPEDVGVFIADLAKLKQINSDAGHRGGDTALLITADALRYAQKMTRRELPFAEQPGAFKLAFQTFLERALTEDHAGTYDSIKSEPAWQQIRAHGIAANFGYATLSELDPELQEKILRAENDRDRWSAIKQATNRLVEIADAKLFPEKTSERINEIVRAIPREEAEMRLRILKREEELQALADRAPHDPVVDEVGRQYVELRIWQLELAALERNRGGSSFSDIFRRNYEVLRGYVSEGELIELAALEDGEREERIQALIKSKM